MICEVSASWECGAVGRVWFGVSEEISVWWVWHVRSVGSQGRHCRAERKQLERLTVGVCRWEESHQCCGKEERIAEIETLVADYMIHKSIMFAELNLRMTKISKQGHWFIQNTMTVIQI